MLNINLSTNTKSWSEIYKLQKLINAARDIPSALRTCSNGKSWRCRLGRCRQKLTSRHVSLHFHGHGTAWSQTQSPLHFHLPFRSCHHPTRLGPMQLPLLSRPLNRRPNHRNRVKRHSRQSWRSYRSQSHQVFMQQMRLLFQRWYKPLQLKNFLVWRILWRVHNSHANWLKLGLPHSSRYGHFQNAASSLCWNHHIRSNQEVSKSWRLMCSHWYWRPRSFGCSICKCFGYFIF